MLQAVAKVLTDRLEQKNPHKVWLAIMLIREVGLNTQFSIVTHNKLSL